MKIDRRLSVFSKLASLALLASTGFALPAKPQPLTVPPDTIVATDAVDGIAPGRTAGGGGVTGDGAAQYTIPLWVPPGRAGIQPSLSLVYNSRRGNGPVGVGWTLTGLSQITRCPRTFLQDGEAREIRFTDGEDGDRFCLDGQRLVVVGGPNGPASVYGGHGTEYRTEHNIHAKIVSYVPDELGPTYFEAYLKDGRVLTFGGDPARNSSLEGQRVHVSSELVGHIPPNPGWWEYRSDYSQRVRYSWALTRMADRVGNYMTVSYDLVVDQDRTEFNLFPRDIAYTASDGGSGTKPTRRVHFGWQWFGLDRPGLTTYVGGLRLWTPYRLSRIEVYQVVRQGSGADPGEDTLLRSHRLKYSMTGSMRSLLDEVQECDGLDICKAPISFKYSSASDAYSNSNTHVSIGGVYFTGDLNGDGLDDVTGTDKILYSNGDTLGITGGQGPAGCSPDLVPLPSGPGGYPLSARQIDLNADGRDDCVKVRVIGQSPPYRFKNVISYAGLGLVEDDVDTPVQYFPSPEYALDLNGDGLPDLVGSGGPDSLSVSAYRLNAGGSYGPYVGANGGRIGHRQYGAQAIDLKGSGKFSLLGSEGAVGLEGGALHVEDTNLRTFGSGCPDILLDFNGDGLSDSVSVHKQVLKVAINTGNGFAEPREWQIPSPFNAALPEEPFCDTLHRPAARRGHVAVIDYNGDGLQDLLLMKGILDPSAAAPEFRQIVVLQSTGTGFKPHLSSIYAGGNPESISSPVLDANGDGLEDLLQVIEGELHLYIRQGKPPDLLTRVVDGQAVIETFEYSPISSTNVYYRADDCTYPQLCVKRGLWVVSSHTTDNGPTEPGRTVWFTYSDGRTDLAGRRWLGFAWRIAQEEAVFDRFYYYSKMAVEYDNRTRASTFYPCAGFATSTTGELYLTPHFDSSVRLVRHRTTKARCEVVLQNNGKTYFSYPSFTETSDAEGALETAPVLLRTDSVRQTQDDYGNIIFEEHLAYPVKDGRPTGRPHKTTVTRQYDNFDPPWLIGQERRTQVTSTVPSGRGITRTVEREYYPDTGLLWKTKIEPGDRPGSTDGSDFYLETTLGRNAYGLVTSVLETGSGEARTVTVEYDDDDHTFPKSVTNTAGHKADFAYHSGVGVLAAERDPNGSETRYRYDGFGRLRFVDAPDDADQVIRYLQDAETGTLTVRTEPVGEGAAEVSYDRLGRELRRRWQGFDGTWAYTSASYDYLGRVKMIALPFAEEPASAGDPCPCRLEFEYDNLGRPLAIRHPDETTAKFEYIGLETRAWDEKGNPSFVVEDELGRIVASTQGQVTTRYEYGPFDVLERVIGVDGQVPVMEYDKLGRPERLVDPDAGVNLVHYSAFGEVKDATDGSGDRTSYTYDALGRVRTITTKDGVTSFTWDTAAHGRGLLASSTSPDGVTTEYAYDSLSRPERIVEIIEGEPYEIGYTYDSLGRLETVSYPTVEGHPRLTTRHEYNDWGYLDSVRDPNSGVIYWRAIARDVGRRFTTERFGNDVTTTRHYDPEGWLRLIDTRTATDTVLQALEYEYEPNRNLRFRYDRVAGTTERFSYDSLDRIEGWWVTQDTTGKGNNYLYNPSSNSNFQIWIEPTGLISFEHGEDGAGPHAVTRVGAARYNYDTAGNQKTGPDRSLDYTAFGLPASISGSQMRLIFKYDAGQERVLKRREGADAGYTAYVGGLYEKRVKADSTVHVFYIVGPERPIAQILWTTSQGGSLTRRTLYLHDDHLGSTETVSNEAGGLVERFKYDPFGTRRDAQHLATPASLPHGEVRRGFTGHEHDDEFGLINMRGRIYDPKVGRFLTPDPLIGNPFDGRFFNRYNYALNNPLSYTDPTGLDFTGVDGGSETITVVGPPPPAMGGSAGASTSSGQESDTVERLRRDHSFDPVTLFGEVGRDHSFDPVTLFGRPDTGIVPIEDYPVSDPLPGSSGPPWTGPGTSSEHASSRRSVADDRGTHQAPPKSPAEAAGGPSSPRLNIMDVGMIVGGLFWSQFTYKLGVTAQFAYDVFDLEDAVYEYILTPRINVTLLASANKSVLSAAAKAALARTAAIGRQAHKQILRELLQKGKIDADEAALYLAPGMRTVRKDGVRLTPKGLMVYIIKPDTPTGRLAARIRSKLMKEAGYIPKTVLYDPNNPAYLVGSRTYIP